MRRLQFPYIVFSVLFFVIGLIGLVIKDDLFHYFQLSPASVLLTSVLSILIGISFFLMLYVRGFLSSSILIREELENSLNGSTITEPSLEAKFEKLKNELVTQLQTGSDAEEVRRQIKETIDRQMNDYTEEKIIEEISKRFEVQLTSQTKLSIIDYELLSVKNRIHRETARLNRYGYINLMIGFITTFLAIFFLGYSLVGQELKNFTPSDYLYHFIPRISLSVLIELFSFFFLKMYKKNLDDIKYFNNERTNIEMKIVAIKTAFLYGDTEIMKKLVTDLSKTERNFVLKKDESTVEIQKTKIESDSNNQLLGGILKILERK